MTPAHLAALERAISARVAYGLAADEESLLAEVVALVRGAIPATPYALPPEDALATSGLGPRWRLMAASVKHPCPRHGDGRCGNLGACNERVWAYAAKRRRERWKTIESHDAESLVEVCKAAAHDPVSLEWCIKYGLVRLAYDKDGALEWVDAT